MDPHLKKSESPSPKETLCQFWLKLTYPVVLENKSKIGKVYRQTDRQRSIVDQKSSLELLAQMSLQNRAEITRRQ